MKKLISKEESGTRLLHLLIILLVLLAILYSTADANAAEHVIAAHYAPNVMEKRAIARRLPIVSCMISSPVLVIGTWVDLANAQGDYEHARVTDTSQPWDRARHIAAQQIELDWNCAKRLCHIKRVGQKRPRDCPLHLSLDVSGAKARTGIDMRNTLHIHQM